jgi:hypothetical protein
VAGFVIEAHFAVLKMGVSATIEARYLPGRIATVAKRIFVTVFYIQYRTAIKQTQPDKGSFGVAPNSLIFRK